jgi:ribosomal protein L11 methylase PrmA
LPSILIRWAISTAKANARLNGLRSVQFRVGDVLRCRIPSNVNVVTANLFSELLVQLIPRLHRPEWLILSGIMRDQEADVERALKRNNIKLVTVRRRGKWIAILATNPSALAAV